jgi:hypothetical protein
MKTASGARQHSTLSMVVTTNHGWRGFAAVTALFLAPLLSGCGSIARDTSAANAQGAASLPALPAPRLSLDEIVTLSRQGVGADALIARIQVAGSYYRLSTAQIMSLRERGVPVAVIDHMLMAERQYATRSSMPAVNIQVSPGRNGRQSYVAALYHGY